MKTANAMGPVCRGSLAFLLCSVIAVQNLDAREQCHQVHLTGTFLQLLEPHGNWTEQQWRTLFDSLNSIGIRELILQWSVVGDLAFYSSKEFRTVKNAPFETILKMADSAGMQTWIGLVQDPDYWSYLQKDTGTLVSYLNKHRSRSVAAATELASLFPRHPSIHGWYISEEIDDTNWRTQERRDILFNHVGALTEKLKRLTPDSSVAISAFSQAQTSPQAFEQFWDEFFQRTGINAMLFQDGVGVNKLTLDDLPPYLEAMRKAAEKNHRCARVVVELLRQTSGPPLDKSAFSAVPGPLDRIIGQIQIASKYSCGGIVGFSVPEYMTPAGGEAARKLFLQYKALGSSCARFTSSDDAAR